MKKHITSFLLALILCCGATSHVSAGDPLVKKDIILGTKRIFVYVDYDDLTPDSDALSDVLSSQKIEEILVDAIKYRFASVKDRPCLYECFDQPVYVISDNLDWQKFMQGEATSWFEEGIAFDEDTLLIVLRFSISPKYIAQTLQFDRPGKRILSPQMFGGAGVVVRDESIKDYLEIYQVGLRSVMHQ